MIKEEYYVLVPENLDIEKLLELHPPNFKFNIDYAYFIISDILLKTAYLQDINQTGYIYNTSPYYIPKYSQNLQNLCRNYNRHMKYLCDSKANFGNILFRKNYTKGISFSYQIAPNYKNKKLKKYIIRNWTFRKNIYTTKDISNNIKKRYNYLINYFDSKRLTIEFDEALKYLNEEIEKLSGQFDEKTKKHKKILLNAFKLQNVQNGHFYMKYSPDTDGRIHTTLTGFPKVLRKFLRYDNESLGEVDISASIPTFLCYLLFETYKFQKNYIIKNELEHKLMLQKFKKNISEKSFSTFYSHFSNVNEGQTINLYKIFNSINPYILSYMLVKLSTPIDIIEIEHFKSLIQNKKFYDEFQKSYKKISTFQLEDDFNNYFINKIESTLGREFDGDYINDFKKVAKKRVLACMNAKNGSKNYLVEQIVFQKIFPNIYRFIELIKIKNHKFFCYLMLHIESYFMLDIVARKINSKHKRQVLIYTLHDCIITTKSNVQLVKTEMKQILKESLGFEPCLSESYYA